MATGSDLIAVLTGPLAGAMTRLDVLLALCVAAGIGLLLAQPRRQAQRPLDQRIRDRLKGRASPKPQPRQGWRLGGSLRRLTTDSALTEALQKARDWIWDRAPLGRGKQLMLRQAGLRAHRVYLYFEATRLALGLLGFVLALMLDTLVPQLQANRALAIVLVAVVPALGLYLPELYLKSRIQARRRAFEAGWDDAIGLLIICLDAGLSIEIALRRIARELAPTAPVLAEELTITVTDLAILPERRLAYLNLAQRIESTSVKTVTVALIQAEKQGASIAMSLRRITQADREDRISRAETKAAALGPKMTVPMIIFFLPVVFVVIIAPIVMTAHF